MAERYSIKIIAMDFDLTLYDHSSPTDTLQLQPIFKKLHNKGIMLGLASGRSVEELKEPLENIGFLWGKPFPDFVICNEGEIRTPDGTDWSDGGMEWNLRRNQLVYQANAKLLPYFEKLVDWAGQNGFTIIRDIQMNTCGINIVFETPEVAEQARNFLAKNISHMPEIEVSRNHHIVVAIPKQASKGAALRELVNILGVRPGEVLAIGDNINDMSMLSKDNGFIVATVANADPYIRSYIEGIGGIVARGTVSFGIYEILLRFFSACLQ